MAFRSALLVGLLGQQASVGFTVASDHPQDCQRGAEAEGCIASALSKEHQLLQLSGKKVQMAHKHKSDQTIPGQFKAGELSRGQASETLTDPSNLRLVWADEFDGDHVDPGKWRMHEGGGGFGNQELQYYTGRNARVSNGVLTITAKCDSYGGQRFTSAKLETKHRGDWGPGHRIEVRARVPKGKGTWPAIWMLPTHKNYGGWPRSGEIDIMESVGCTADKVYGTVHTEAYNHMRHTEKSNSVWGHVDAWHTYTVDWTEHQISWYFDGKLFHTFAPDSFEYQKWPYDHQFYLILNVAVGGSWGGYCLHGRSPSCHASDEFGQSQVMEVDYARVYAL